MKAIISVILAFYVLTGSVGTPFSKHTCFANDTTEFGFSIEDNCCGSNKKVPEPASQTGASCCDFASTYFQLDLNVLSFAGIIAFAAPSIIQNFDYMLPQIEEQQLVNSIANAIPSLHSGRDLLAFVQSFII